MSSGCVSYGGDLVLRRDVGGSRQDCQAAQASRAAAEAARAASVRDAVLRKQQQLLQQPDKLDLGLVWAHISWVVAGVPAAKPAGGADVDATVLDACIPGLLTSDGGFNIDAGVAGRHTTPGGSAPDKLKSD